jgi:outer membrane protein W
MLNVSFGVFDFLDVYIKLGGADYTFKSDLIDTSGFPGGDAKINTKWGFAYGGGVKGAYAFKNGFLVGADVQYLRHRQKYRKKITYLGGSEELSTGHATFQEWQIGPFVGYKIMKFIPYVGVKYSDVRLKFNQEDGTQKFKADDHVGAFVGLTYDILPQLRLNLEGRFIDETGMNLNVIFRF